MPGELKGYWEVHQRFGRLEWKELIKPTIELCKNGTVITNYLGKILKSKEADIRAEPTMKELLVDPITDKLLKVSFNYVKKFLHTMHPKKLSLLIEDPQCISHLKQTYYFFSRTGW